MREKFSKEINTFEGYNQPYRFHKPDFIEEGKNYPLVLFLHGAGERGEDNDHQLDIGILTALSDENSILHQSFIICPQVPLEKQWVATPWDMGAYSTDEIEETLYLKAATSLVRETAEKYPVDKKRIYVMGISMGGYGTWDSIVRHTDLYAGAFACCGAGDTSKADKIKNLKIYAFHGALDDTVPTCGSRDMVAALEKAGCKTVCYTEYPELYHNSWDAAYSEFDKLKELLSTEK